jgi:hypothetical protein
MTIRYCGSLSVSNKLREPHSCSVRLHRLYGSAFARDQRATEKPLALIILWLLLLQVIGTIALGIWAGHSPPALEQSLLVFRHATPLHHLPYRSPHSLLRCRRRTTSWPCRWQHPLRQCPRHNPQGLTTSAPRGAPRPERAPPVSQPTFEIAHRFWPPIVFSSWPIRSVSSTVSIVRRTCSTEHRPARRSGRGDKSDTAATSESCHVQT